MILYSALQLKIYFSIFRRIWRFSGKVIFCLFISLLESKIVYLQTIYLINRGIFKNSIFLMNCSFYPKYPSDIKTPIDYTHYENLYFKSCSPDILITPSKLPRFVKSSDSQLCVNPERLVKSENPGTFAFFTIHPLATTSLGILKLLHSCHNNFRRSRCSSGKF